MEEKESKNRSHKGSFGILYVLLSFLLFGFLCLIYESGNISIKGIESSVDDQPIAFYTTMSILFGLCLSILIFGLSEMFKLKRRGKDESSNNV